MTTDFSRIAHAYRWMEYASFGTLLERTRFLRIPAMLNSRRALILGDGDGRFLHRLLQTDPNVLVDSVDLSPGMVRLAQARVAALGLEATKCVQWYVADSLVWEPPPSQSGRQYDLIVTHFFLDCFSTADVRRLVARLMPLLSPGGVWINSDFAIPAHGWMRWPSRFIVQGLYAAFYLLAGLRTQQLPDDVPALRDAGLLLEHQSTLAGGLLKSELWRKPAPLLTSVVGQFDLRG
jgi:SAM-dependent methyltransferase